MKERKPTPAGYVPYVERGPFRPSRILDWGVRPGFHDAPPDPPQKQKTKRRTDAS